MESIGTRPSISQLAGTNRPLWAARVVATFTICLAISSTPTIARSAEPVHREIDRIVLAQAGGPVAERSTDAEFLRRIRLDFAGTIPTADETRKFLADANPRKRTELIDRLLAAPEYARRMQQAITVMLLERRAGKLVSDSDWNELLRASFAENKPWDRLVRDIVLADGGDDKTHAAVRFFVDGGRNSHHQMTQDVARLFLGMNILCAQCHDHPTIDDYKQSDYFGLFAYLSQSKLHTKSPNKRPYLAETPAKMKIDFQSVFSPEDKQSIGPRLPGGKEVAVLTFEKGQELAKPAADGLPAVPKFQPRILLADDLTSPANSRFVRNGVNRFWFLMMSRGLVHPLDLDHSANPPSHPELLDLLAREFVAHKFDVKWLLREIALSDAYQCSSLLPEGVAAKDAPAKSFRVFNTRSLSPEQMAFSLMRATGHLAKLQAAKVPETSEFTVKDYISGKIADPPSNLPDALKVFAAIFGSPPGEPEDEFAPSMGQALFLSNEKLVFGWLKPAAGNLVDRLGKLQTDDAVAEELYLSVLSRTPVKEERLEVAVYLKEHAQRRNEALTELAWALLTSTEFRLNH